MNNEKMGKFICDMRKSQKLTQKDLAEKLKITDKAVSKWERGGSLRYRYHINPTLTFAQPIQPEGWITRKGGMRPVEG